MPDDDEAKGGRHLVGYARVSMDDQTVRRQVAALVEFGIPECDIFTDSASGKDMNRPGWEACWKDLREGDLLVVQALDRLGRNTREILATVEALHRRGCDLKLLTMPIDSREPTGELMMTILAALAQYERRVINQRTADGLKRAREAGRIGGTRARNNHEDVLAAYAAHGITKAAWTKVGLGKSGFIKAVARARAALPGKEASDEQP